MRLFGKVNDKNGDEILTDCFLEDDSGNPINGVVEANLKVVAGETPILEVKIFSKNSESAFPKNAIRRHEKSRDNDMEFEVYEFLLISVNVETKEKLALVNS